MSCFFTSTPPSWQPPSWHSGRVAVLVALAALVLALPAAAEPFVSGRVLGPDGEPLPGARVVLSSRESCHERGLRLLSGEAPEALATARSDEEGRFRVEAPEFGLYEIAVEAKGLPAVTARLMPLVADRTLPDAELLDARDVRVTARLAGEPLADARIQVVGSSMHREGRGFFRNRSPWRPRLDPARTDAEGAARVQVPMRGEWRIVGWADGYPAVAEELPETSSIRLDFAPSPGVPLEIVTERGRLVEDVVVWSEFDIPIHAEDGRATLFFGENPIGATACAADGSEGHGQFRPDSVAARDGGDGEPDGDGDVDGEPEPLRLTLEAPTTWSGRVIEAIGRRGVAGALVWSSGRSTESTRTDSRGRYTITQRRGGVGAAAPGYVEAHGGGESAGDGEGPTLVLEPAARLEGHVVDAEGRGVAGAEVRLVARPVPGSMRSFRVAANAPITLSDSDGTFRFATVVRDLPYALEARREGFARSRIWIEKLEAFERRTGVEIVLSAGRRAIGQVVDESDQPVVGAQVTLEAEESSSDLRARLQRAMTRTEDDAPSTQSDGEGRFRFEDLGPGRFRLTARAAGFAPVDVPGVEIPRTAEAEVDLGVVALVPGAAIEGRVVDPDGGALSGATVSVSEARGGRFIPTFGQDSEDSRATTTADGTFRVADLRPGGRFRVEVRLEGYADVDLDAVPAPVEEPLRVVLEPAARLLGRVVDAAGAGVKGARVRASAQAGGRMGAFGRGAPAVTEAEGTFELEGVTPGRIELSVKADGYQEYRRSDLEVAAGEELGGLEIVLERGEQVSGTVRAPDGTPLDGVMVMARPAGSEAGRFFFGGGAMAQTDGDGRYQLDSLAPGPHQLRAQHDVYGAAEETVEIEADAENRLDLAFTGGVEVSGVALDAETGQPVANAGLRLVGGGTGRFSSVASDAAGRFTFVGVPPGTYDLMASAEGRADVRIEDLAVGGGGADGIEVLFESGATLVGRVTGLDFDEMAQVVVMVTGSSGMLLGSVDFEGRYRVENLAPGGWSIRAASESRGEQITESFEVEEGESEVVVDLEFGTGLTLEGTIRRRGEAVAGAAVSAERSDGTVPGRATSEPSGRFTISGLEPGQYQIHVREHVGGARHTESVELFADRSVAIELRTARLAGRVVDAVTGEPIDDAAIALDRLGGSDAEPDPFAFFDLGNASDSEGRFRVGEVSAGTWRLRVTKPGYAADERRVDVVEGQDRLDLVVSLAPVDAVDLRVLGPSGPVSGTVHVVVSNAAGDALVSTTAQAENDGRVRLTTVPPGRWVARVSVDGLPTVRVSLQAPGDAGTVTLGVGGTVEVTVPELAEDPVAARVRFLASDGEAYRAVLWGGRLASADHALASGRERVRLPVGTWTIEASAEDGRSWRSVVTVTEGAEVSTILE